MGPPLAFSRLTLRRCHGLAVVSADSDFARVTGSVWTNPFN